MDRSNLFRVITRDKDHLCIPIKMTRLINMTMLGSKRNNVIYTSGNQKEAGISAALNKRVTVCIHVHSNSQILILWKPSRVDCTLDIPPQSFDADKRYHDCINHVFAFGEDLNGRVSRLAEYPQAASMIPCNRGLRDIVDRKLGGKTAQIYGHRVVAAREDGSPPEHANPWTTHKTVRQAPRRHDACQETA